LQLSIDYRTSPPQEQGRRPHDTFARPETCPTAGVGASGKGARITWIGGTGARQLLDCSTNLVSGPWTTVFTNEPPTAVTNSVVDTGAASDAVRIYRLKARR
jgi:hypothetical protein